MIAPDTIPCPPPVHVAPCPNCEGHGVVTYGAGYWYDPVKVGDETCLTCSGSGEVLAEVE